MKLVLKPWIIESHFKEKDLKPEDILNRYSIVCQKERENNFGLLSGETSKAIKYIRFSKTKKREVVDFVPQKAVVLIDDTMNIEKQIGMYLLKIRKSEKDFAFKEVQSFLKVADI